MKCSGKRQSIFKADSLQIWFFSMLLMDAIQPQYNLTKEIEELLTAGKKIVGG